jgi:hypothetical protein
MIFDPDDRYDNYSLPTGSPPEIFPFERVYPKLTADESPRWIEWGGYDELFQEERAYLVSLDRPTVCDHPKFS